MDVLIVLITLLKDSKFENNVAGSNGGAIDWHAGAANGRIENSVFNNNTAHRSAGAVFWNGDTGVIVGSNFTNNNVTGTNPSPSGKGGDGGAIVWLGPNGLVDDCNFINNHAPETGGAVYLESSNLGSSDNTTFSNSYFENNTAGINGGAINWHEGATNGKVENSSFVDNSAGANGGAVFWFGTKGTIVDSNFTKNRANGTAVGHYGNSGNGGAVIWTGSDGVVDNCIFDDNYATNNGGAVYLRNLTHGGCNNIKFSDSKFVNNSAGNNGGAIDWHEGATKGRITTSVFENNSAVNDGGAVFWTGHNGQISESNFTVNTANRGGAVFWSGYGGKVSESRFISNNATYGGAIFLKHCQHDDYMSINIEDSYFENNTAVEDGCAINWYDGEGVTVSYGNFVRNTAKRGGAVFINATDGSVTHSEFIYNEAILGGAAYLNNEGLTISDDKFNYNNAVHGGAVYMAGDEGKIRSSNFHNNNATYTLRLNTSGTDKKTNGGAVYIAGKNNEITGSQFIDNTAVATNESSKIVQTTPGLLGAYLDTTGVNDDGLGGAIYVGNNNIGC